MSCEAVQLCRVDKPTDSSSASAITPWEAASKKARQPLDGDIEIRFWTQLGSWGALNEIFLQPQMIFEDKENLIQVQKSKPIPQGKLLIHQQAVPRLSQPMVSIKVYLFPSGSQ